MKKISKNNQTLFYKIVETNNKHTYLKPQNGYLLIRKSKHAPKKQILEHVKTNFDKYLKSTTKIDDNILSLWGKKYKIIIKEKKEFSYELISNEITVSTMLKSYEQIKIKILFEEMRKYLKKNIEKFETKLNEFSIKLVPIDFKYLKSKFGSYHYLTNKVVLNVFLATLEPNYTDCVFYHEFAHQKEKNHQKGFYALLEKLFKNYKYYSKNLKKITIKI